MKERYLLEDGGDNSFSLITDYDGNDEQAFDVNVKSGEILPVFLLFLRKSDARLPDSGGGSAIFYRRSDHTAPWRVPAEVWKKQ